MDKLYIHSLSSVSAMGENHGASTERFWSDEHFLSQSDQGVVGILPQTTERALEDFLKEHPRFLRADRLVHLAAFAGSKLNLDGVNPESTALILGSSRGPTGAWETGFQDFLKNGKSSSQTSPFTTLGGPSSMLAHFLGLNGPISSHSTTCGSFGTGMIHAYGLLNSGLVEDVIVGGAEAPCTPFTLSQMNAMGISADWAEYPCRPFDASNPSGMVLAEAAVVFRINRESNGALAEIIGLGWGNEEIPSKTGMTETGVCLQASMTKALEGIDPVSIDLILAHAPGTRMGDQSEAKAIQAVFGGNHPPIRSMKWKTGHSLGASMGQSLEAGVSCLAKCQIPPQPYTHIPTTQKPVKRLMINGVGFGGNASTLVIQVIQN